MCSTSESTGNGFVEAEALGCSPGCHLGLFLCRASSRAAARPQTALKQRQPQPFVALIWDPCVWTLKEERSSAAQVLPQDCGDATAALSSSRLC